MIPLQTPKFPQRAVHVSPGSICGILAFIVDMPHFAVLTNKLVSHQCTRAATVGIACDCDPWLAYASSSKQSGIKAENLIGFQLWLHRAQT